MNLWCFCRNKAEKDIHTLIDTIHKAVEGRE